MNANRPKTSHGRGRTQGGRGRPNIRRREERESGLGETNGLSVTNQAELDASRLQIMAERKQAQAEAREQKKRLQAQTNESDVLQREKAQA